MINLAVINLRDIIKCMLIFILLVFVLWGINNFQKSKKEIKANVQINNENIINKVPRYAFEKCINESIPGIRQVMNEKEFLEDNENDEDKKVKLQANNKKNKLTKIMNIELAMIEKTEKEEIKENQDEIEKAKIDDSNSITETENETKKQEENKPIEQAKVDVSTEVVQENNLEGRYTDTYGNVKIRNESKYQLTQEMLNSNCTINNKKDIILFHTHTCESYTMSPNYNYTMTGTYRTTDLNYSVVRVGDELETHLKNYGYNVIHDKTYHDYPAYTGSYSRSIKTVQNLLAQNPATEIVFDVHRDAVGSKSNYAPKVKIGDEYAAQIMFVMGSDGGGLSHPNWQQNLKFAIKIQEKANEMYPGLCRPIILRNSRYNQNLTNKAGIIEVGATRKYIR